MANIVNVTVESLETINTNSGGAQWVINRPKANYWKKVYRILIGYIATLEAKNKYTIWTAEMWAQLWNMMYFNIGLKFTRN